MRTHQNKVTLTNPLITTIRYIDHSFHAPKGQALQQLPVTISQDDYTWTLSTNSDHQASADIARAFSAACNGNMHVYAPSSSAKTPTTLNFYYGVCITFLIGGVTYTTNLFLGHGPATWWIGGNNMTNNHAPWLALNSATSSSSPLLRLSGTVDTFNFVLVLIDTNPQKMKATTFRASRLGIL